MPHVHATLWLAWTAAGLFYFTQDFVPRLYRNEPVPWQHVFVGWMAAMYICAVFTPALLWLGRRWPIEQGSRWQRVALHFGCSAIFSAVTSAIEAPVLTALGVFPAVGPARSLGTVVSILLVNGFHGGVIRYWAVIGLQAVYRSHQNAQARERESLRLLVQSSELGAQLSAARLSALKMQLQPHFLFNTLGAIMSLVRQQKTQQAETMIGRLSDLLRLTLDDVNTQEVPLWRELEFLGLYLSIEQVRFRGSASRSDCGRCRSRGRIRSSHGAPAYCRECRPPRTRSERTGREHRRRGEQGRGYAGADRHG